MGRSALPRAMLHYQFSVKLMFIQLTSLLIIKDLHCIDMPWEKNYVETISMNPPINISF